MRTLWILSKDYDALVAAARAGDEDAIDYIAIMFCSLVGRDKPVPPPVLKYIAEHIKRLAHGEHVEHALGLPRRGRGQPRRGQTLADRGRLAKEQPENVKIATRIAELILDGTKLTEAYIQASEELGGSVSRARRAWRRFGPISTYALEFMRIPSVKALDQLCRRFGHDRVMQRLDELELSDRRDSAASRALVDFAAAGSCPDEWRAPPVSAD